MLSIILAGLLSLPSLLVVVVTLPVVALLSIPPMLLLISRKQQASAAVTTESSHRRVIVTGGSSGIGLAIAIAAAKRGIGKIVLVARNVERLEAAKEAVLQASTNKDCKVMVLSVDVSDAAAVEKMAQEVFQQDDDEKKSAASAVTHVFMCAGEPHPAYFEQIKPSTFKKLVEINQLGSIYTAQAVLQHMKAGTLTFCSSMAGQVGVFGYTAYSPTKFALRGFAECLHSEVTSRPIAIQVAYPPDTQTPGYDKENKDKPAETRLISEQGGLAQPSEIGGKMLAAALSPNPSFSVYFSFDAWMLSNLTAGMSPVTTLFDAVSQVAGMSLFRWISLFYLKDFDRIIRAYQNKESRKEKPKSYGTDAAATAKQ